MYLGKLFFIFVLLVSVHAEAAKSSTRFAVGAGYMIFGEKMKTVSANVRDDGIANYAGLVAYAEHTWTKNRWVRQIALGIGTGKATADGFASTTTYPDAGQRSWTLFYLEASGLYRIDPKISTGIGLIAGSRSADWKSEANPALEVASKNKMLYAPEFLLRWTISRRFTLIQSIATPDFRGDTMWRWTGQFNF